MNSAISLLVFVCLDASVADQGDKAAKLATYSAMKASLEKDGWMTQREPINVPTRPIDGIDLKKTKFALPDGKDDQPTHIRLSWVVAYGPLDIPKGKTESIDLFVKSAGAKLLVYKTKDGKTHELSLAEQPIQRTTMDDWDTRFKYPPTGKTDEKLVIIQTRVELLHEGRVVGTGFTSACGTIVFKKK